ncbi:response regulator transcription factor [Pseudonocardia petroleophila]|uniref:helix-turn-helix transcriptional regulator n=1 Tax=Pseudonocardia petroleophila TaxID=37331 RepID=UPI0021059EC4|nr:LuxR C-terminal-related transcriptional regulator [Pseudonocardia petroleophila]
MIPIGPTVLVVDDHELVATTLVLGLRAEGLDARTCAPVTATAQEGPGLVLLDLDLGRDARGRRLDGVTLVEPLRARGWTVLVLSGTADRARVGAALAEGAVAAVPKAAPFPRLLAAVRAALAGGEAMSDARRRELVELHAQRSVERRALAARLGSLTPREREVLAHLAAGHRAQAVADTFVVSLATVRSQIRAILTKLGVSSQLEAVALYRKAAPPDGVL